jgi:hypothetical protein
MSGVLEAQQRRYVGVHKQIAGRLMVRALLYRWTELFAMWLTRLPLTKLAPMALPAPT